MSKRQHPEKDLHIACVEWALYNKVKYPKLSNLFHVPNQGKRGLLYALSLKRMGARAGVPDLMIPAQTKHNAGLAIEFKADKGTATDAQEEFMNMLVAEGWMCAVVRSVDGFIKVVEEYFK